jgi:hypothetical protein
MSNPEIVTTTIEHLESAAQNQEASQADPLDVAAATHLDASFGVQSDASLAVGSAIPATNEAPRMFVNPDVLAAVAQNISNLEEELSQEEANAHMEKAIYSDVVVVPASDTSPEQQLAAAINGFVRASKIRYEGLLEQSTTQSEILRSLGDAIIHLNDHVAQHALEEKTNA